MTQDVLTLIETNRARVDHMRHDAPQVDVDHAVASIAKRVRSGERAGPLTLRRSKIRLLNTPVDVARVDPIEQLIVQLISGRRPGQFSFTPQGDVFVTMAAGWHRGIDRIDVSGISAVLETLAGYVEAHRNGRGGRVSVSPQVARCYNCYDVLLALNKAPTLEHVATPGVCQRRSSG